MPRTPVLIVAGEASGDLCASKLAERLLAERAGLELFGVGGDRMARAGVELVHHVDEVAVTGLVEVIAHVPRLKRAMDGLFGMAVRRGARLAILVDYPGFNLRLAKRLHAAGVAVMYYVSPQVWAWGEGRVREIAASVDRMVVILPFERDFYAARGIEAEFVGHPLMEEPELAARRSARSAPGGGAVVGLLPGSRPNEIRRHLGPMLEAVRRMDRPGAGLRFRLGTAGGEAAKEIKGVVRTSGAPVEVLLPGETHGLMREAHALIVSSGTATLEAAAFGTPMVVIYRMAPVSYLAARLLVKIPDIGLVNVVAGRRIVPELVQGRASGAGIAREVGRLLSDGALYERTSRELLGAWRSLGEPGASGRAAAIALEMLGREA